ncbi:hypothetical protein IJG93_01340 [Candidatus Saccharibacteria bacterium]|nr:hypothetical protein [Candidatus Saccharibacteria bacterium]
MLLNTSGGECYGTYNSSTGIGSGAGYINACIHSGSNTGSGGNTVWYNYVATSAGTIKNSSSSDTTGNINIDTESVCPKGWTLPSKTQMDNIGGTSPGSSTYVPSFSPVLGGYYHNGSPSSESTQGTWWGNEASIGASRHTMYYNDSNLFTGRATRSDGLYIRCVSEEKDVSDLTYMQDMTPSVAANTAERTAFPTILQ